MWEEFLAEYRKLCLKYGHRIDSCECCSSPWIVEVGGKRELAKHVEHLREYATKGDMKLRRKGRAK